MKKAEVAVSGSIFIVSAYIFLASKDYPKIILELGGSPGFYPRILAGGLSLLGFLLLLRSLKEPKGLKEPFSFALRMNKSFLILPLAIVFLLAMPLGMVFFGFLPTSFFFLLVLMVISQTEPMKIRHWVIIPLLSALIVAVIYVVFQLGCKVPLPVGKFWE